MIKRAVYSTVSFLAGIFLLVIPNFLNYFNKDSFPFDFASFLTVYPALRYITGIGLVLIGVVEILYLLFFRKDKTVFVIQKGSDGDYGNPDIHFPKLAIGNRDEMVYENLATLKNHDQAIVGLEKKRIRRFYENLPDKKAISFLGIATMPSLVFAGYVVGESGRKVNYFHWIREKSKAAKLWGWNDKYQSSLESVTQTESNEYAVCVSTSYLIDTAKVCNQFSGLNIKYYRLKEIGKDIIKSKSSLLKIAQEVRDIIANLEGDNVVAHLLLSCSAELCFAIGQKLNSPALPRIIIYSFDGKAERQPWNWSLELSN